MENKSKGNALEMEDDSALYITDKAPLIIIQADFNCTILDINSTEGGYTKADIIGKSILDFVIPEYRDIIVSTSKQVIEGGEQLYYETHWVGLDGIWRWYITNVCPVYEKDKLSSLTYITRETTAKKLALENLKASEEKRRQSEANLRTVFDNSTIGYVLLDLEIRILSFNNLSNALLRGVSGKELELGMLLLDYYPADELERMKPRFDAALQGEKVDYERKIGLRDEKIIWLKISISPVTNDADEVINLLLKFENITDQKQKEENLEERFKYAVEGSNDGVWDWNLETKLIYLSPRSRNMLGYKEEEMESYVKDTDLEIHPEDRDSVAQEVRNAFKTKVGTHSIEYRFKCKDGTYKWIFSRGKVIGWKDGRALRMTGTYTDISERKELEVKLRQSIKEKEILLQEVHHRVKNNLQIISSILNLQLDIIDDKSTIDQIRETQDRIRSMSFVHELLYQTKDVLNIDFSKYIKMVAENLMQNYSLDKNIKLNIEVTPAFLDLDQAIPCGLIINELVTNSLKYAFSKGEGGEIKITLLVEEKNLILLVGDDGKGMPETIDFKNSPSLGLQLVVDLVNQIDGSIEKMKDAGTNYRILFSAH